MDQLNATETNENESDYQYEIRRKMFSGFIGWNQGRAFGDSKSRPISHLLPSQ
jgi:uncharacterized protein involved in copper resistance